MQMQGGTNKEIFLKVLMVVVKSPKTATVGMSWPLWSRSFLPAAPPLFHLLQHQHHPKGRLLSRILLRSSIAAACFYRRGVELHSQSRNKTALQENQRVLGILPTRCSPNQGTHASSTSVLPML
ncbi:hypothetical protein HJG60_007878 [Phyllostomus discolor]|uniref:Uncharacterized protein n=1 Tax=Phyllostomus discolor TaxID=89673 RepID=A0A834EVQ5_9CHIR|nr:hypothetical protein HJG60_007878 [Phyllostomus discolor]